MTRRKVALLLRFIGIDLLGVALGMVIGGMM